MPHAWMNLTWNAMRLAIEVQQVMALRMLRLSLGGRLADRESALMVSEKLNAAWLAGYKAMLAAARGRGPTAISNEMVTGYRRRVQANRRRLGAF